MKIRKITLYNIGPYKNENAFEIDDNEKHIILIGGKNGAGKTTFFRAIKTCLYGCRIWGFDANCKPYYDIISTLINNEEKMNNNSLAYIEIQLLFNDGKEDNVYTIKREWHKTNKSFAEKLNVLKNGAEIDESEKNDFNSYLLSIIPPAMFNFYFFDGEEITDFFLGSNGEQNFRDAFLKLYSLDTFSIMKDNFKRNINNSNNKKVFDEYYEIKNNYEEIVKYKRHLERQIRELNKYIDELSAKKESIIMDFKNSGGVTIDEWMKLNKELDYEELKREELSKRIKDIANNYLPFIILNKELIELESKLNSFKNKQKVKH